MSFRLRKTPLRELCTLGANIRSCPLSRQRHFVSGLTVCTLPLSVSIITTVNTTINNNNINNAKRAKDQLQSMGRKTGLVPSLFFNEGREWGRSRRILSPGLNGHKNIANMIPTITKVSFRALV